MCARSRLVCPPTRQHQASTTAPIDLRAILPLTTKGDVAASGYVLMHGIDTTRIVSNLSILLIKSSSEEGQGGSSLGFEALLQALAGASAVKAQVDAMDILKERLKRCPSASDAAEAGIEMEEGYLLMLRLYLDPRAAALRKASHWLQTGMCRCRCWVP